MCEMWDKNILLKKNCSKNTHRARKNKINTNTYAPDVKYTDVNTRKEIMKKL